jgi:hypothetical protein
MHRCSDIIKVINTNAHVLPCVSCISHPCTWVCATWEETSKAESASKLLSPSCSAGPQSMQSLADNQSVTSSLLKLWTGNEAQLFVTASRQALSMSAACISTPFSSANSMTICMLHGDMMPEHALSLGGAVMWPPATSHAL